MWWEILPSSVAFVACLLLPNYIAYPWHYFSQNKHLHSRFWNADEATFRLFTRDRRIAGWEYLRLGLEQVPDLPANHPTLVRARQRLEASARPGPL